ncbi:transporter substrate-binding domain-containing protein [Actinomycetes bacterium NPDC127524]
MKKIGVLGLFFALIIALSACGTSDDGGNGKNKTYRVGIDTTYPPFEYEEGGKYKGIDIDVMNAIAKSQGFKVKYSAMDFLGIIPAMQAGDLDMAIAGMSITDKRKKVVDFSDPYFNAGLSLVVKKGTKDIKTINDLKGKQVAVKKGTTGAAFAAEKADKIGFKVVQFNDSPSMFQEVSNGSSDVLIEDYPVIAYAISKKDLGLEIVGDRLNGDKYGIAVLKGENGDLLKKVNKGLAELKKNGKYDEIIKKYLGDQK